ncbi:MAG: sulfite exporter TauE/SafE family protein [Actinobacteria bacterium]|nr:MAG: sulfite exporter TauE/SafE family protein [Actinomycetota bacterium]
MHVAAYDTAVRLVLIGLAAGFFSALFGVGGGIIIVPLLLLVFALEARVATATSLAAIGITAVSGVIAYAFHGDIRVGYAALVGLPAAASVAGATAVQQRLKTRTLELAFAAFLVAVAVWLFLK